MILRKPLITTILVAVLATLLWQPTGTASAYTAGFDAGQIMSDGIMANSSSMSVSQIQSFLNSKVPSCDTAGSKNSEMNNSGVPDYNKNGSIQRWEWGKARYNQTTFPCLKDYSVGGVKAAQIIYDKAKKYTINPQVLIVLLQKEQGLTTDAWPLNIQYRTATGYGCPDTAPCDSQYYGLANQLDWAAKMYRSILNQSPDWYSPYIKGHNPRVYWHPSSGNYINSTGADDSRAGCGYNSLAIDNWTTAALYSYTPYRPNQAALRAGYGTGDGCSSYGNRNFYSYFTDWFGSTTLPLAIKSSSSSIVYIQTGGYKFSVPSMAMLQDYGINPSSIRTVSVASLNAIPTASSGSNLSTSIGYLVKSSSDTDADGGSVYLVSVGKRNKIRNMDQLTQYGLATNSIRYLPLDFIASLPNGGYLNSYLKMPNNNVFQVSTAKKRLIFDGAYYNQLNPSGAITPASTSLAALITPGKPLSNKPILVQTGGKSVYLFVNENYYAVPNMDVYRCYGFDTSNKLSLNSVSAVDFIERPVADSQLSCSVKNTSGNIYILNGKNKIPVPADVPIFSQTINSDVSSVVSSQPNRSVELSSLVKSSSAAVWYLEDGKRRLVQNLSILKLLGYPQKSIDTIDRSLVESIPTGDNKLPTGAVVKETGNSTIYHIVGSTKIAYSSAELFLAYGNKWENIAEQPAGKLLAYSTEATPVERYLSTSNVEVNYLLDSTGCKLLKSSQLIAHGKTRANLRQYSASAYPNIAISRCNPMSNYVQSSRNTVYFVDNGKKYSFDSWSALQKHSKQSKPTISTVSDFTISLIPNGGSI